MRELIGINTKFILSSGVKFEGKILEVTNELVYVPDKDGKIHRIPKGQIVVFAPDEEPNKERFIPLQILACNNATIGCNGVQYIKKGVGFNRKDFDSFTDGCTHRCDTCKMGSRGTVRNADSQFLAEMLGNMLIGDYPKGDQQ